MSSSDETWEFPGYTKTIHRASYPAIDPTNPANSAKGKVVFVTGGGAGVGKGIAGAFATAGAKAVAILGRREDVLASAKAELSKINPETQILTFQGDIVDEESLNKAFSEAAAQAGPINIVVANAGFLSKPGPIIDADIDDWWRGYEVNIKGTVLTFRAWVPHKATTGTPTFISLNTGLAHLPAGPNFSSYAGSKLGGAGLIPFLQVENPDVRVVSMHPGVIETEMASKSGVPFSRDDISLPSGFAVWLASPAAKWTGGRLLWSQWDVDELAALHDEIVEKDELKLVLNGWPKQTDVKIVR